MKKTTNTIVYKAINTFKVYFETEPVKGDIFDSHKISTTVSEVVELNPIEQGVTWDKHIGFVIGNFDTQHVNDSFKKVFPTLKDAIKYLEDQATENLPKKPKPCCGSICHETDAPYDKGTCKECGSSLKRGLFTSLFGLGYLFNFGVIKGCIQPECKNYYGNKK